MGKYNPLRFPACCVYCKLKNVYYAYHSACQECCTVRKICPKCLVVREIVSSQQVVSEASETSNDVYEEYTSTMRERQRRKFMRYIDKGLSAGEAMHKILEGYGDDTNNEESTLS